MKVIIFFLSLITSSLVAASDWSDRVSFFLDFYQATEYPDFSERIKNVFLSNINNYVKIEIEKNGKMALYAELYYSEGQLVINRHSEGWNLVTKGGYVYEWKYGETTGVKFKKNDKELVDYIVYLTDPYSHMSSLYFKYKTNPERFNVIEFNDKPYLELAKKKPRHDFGNLFVNLDSLWFHGVRQKKQIVYFSTPQEYQSLPNGIKNEMNTVKFKESNLSVTRHLEVL